jgi:hypothetical protein
LHKVEVNAPDANPSLISENTCDSTLVIWQGMKYHGFVWQLDMVSLRFSVLLQSEINCSETTVAESSVDPSFAFTAAVFIAFAENFVNQFS